MPHACLWPRQPRHQSGHGSVSGPSITCCCLPAGANAVAASSSDPPPPHGGPRRGPRPRRRPPWPQLPRQPRKPRQPALQSLVQGRTPSRGSCDVHRPAFCGLGRGELLLTLISWRRACMLLRPNAVAVTATVKAVAFQCKVAAQWQQQAPYSPSWPSKPAIGKEQPGAHAPWFPTGFAALSPSAEGHLRAGSTIDGWGALAPNCRRDICCAGILAGLGVLARSAEGHRCAGSTLET